MLRRRRRQSKIECWCDVRACIRVRLCECVCLCIGCENSDEDLICIARVKSNHTGDKCAVCFFLAHQFRFIFLSFAALHLIIKNVLERDLSQSTRLNCKIIWFFAAHLRSCSFPDLWFPLHFFLWISLSLVSPERHQYFAFNQMRK